MKRAPLQPGTVELQAVFITAAKSGKAILVEVNGEEVWIPESQICPESEISGLMGLARHEAGRLVVTEWIARQKGLI